MDDITPYDDQSVYVHDLREAARHYQAVLGVASTGFGKSVTSALIAKSAAEKGKTVWFTCHRRNLVYQASREFWRLKVEHGLIQSGKTRSRLPVQVASIDTLRRRLDKLEAPSILIVDEAHLSCSRTWSYVIQWCKDRGSLILGNSGSPHRLDGKPLGDLFDVMVEAPSMRWLIDNGRLSDYDIYAPPNPLDTSSLHVRQGEYITREVEDLVDKPKIIGDAIQHYRKYANGKRAVAYCASIKHSLHVTQNFNDAGIPAAHIDGKTSQTERLRIIQEFAAGNIKVLCNVELITMGFDLSAQVGREVPIEACILLRPTHSLALYLQMVGRALRKKPEPAIILDHASCCFKHGLPDDDREWSLEGRKVREKKAEDEPAVNIQQCGACFHVFRAGVDQCPACGEAVERKPRQVEEEDGELQRVEIERAKKEQRREVGMSRTLEDLVALGVRRGMRKPDAWAAHVYYARRGRKPGPAQFREARRILDELEVAA